MPFLGFALGYLIAMCSPGWGNLVAFDWNDLLVGREFEGKFLKNLKSPPKTKVAVRGVAISTPDRIKLVPSRYFKCFLG